MKFVTENWQIAGKIGLNRQQIMALELMKVKSAKREEDARQRKEIEDAEYEKVETNKGGGSK